MDDYMFRSHVQNCKYVQEDTTYLEMFSYSDPSLNTVEEHPLPPNEFEDFLHQTGTFAESKVPYGVKRLAGVRLVIQKNAKNPETFTPHIISLKHDWYMAMTVAFHLPYNFIESTSCVGPMFWSALDSNIENPHLQIIYRKSDVRKKGMTRGWELSLSHDMNSAITAGFCKGTASSDLVECINHLKCCILEINHPILLPIIIFSHDASAKSDIKQRDARDWLRRIEHAIHSYTVKDSGGYAKESVIDLDLASRDIVECHAQVLWKPPVAYLEILQAIKEAAELFSNSLSEGRKGATFRRTHSGFVSRLEFYRRRLQGVQTYANTTLQRLEIQRSLVSNLITQRESNLSLQMAGDQRKIAWASRHDSSTMKIISILGVVFLPGTFVASIFSTTFFNFQNAPDIASAVSPSFWLYWTVTIPVTLVIVGMWYIWERIKASKLEQDAKIEADKDRLYEGSRNARITMQT